MIELCSGELRSGQVRWGKGRGEREGGAGVWVWVSFLFLGGCLGYVGEVREVRYVGEGREDVWKETVW